VIEVKAKKTPAKKATKKKTEAKFTTCPVCVNGRGQDKDIARHNKKHHGGKTPEAR
jgi:hypothetical protein